MPVRFVRARQVTTYLRVLVAAVWVRRTTERGSWFSVFLPAQATDFGVSYLTWSAWAVLASFGSGVSCGGATVRARWSAFGVSGARAGLAASRNVGFRRWTVVAERGR